MHDKILKDKKGQILLKILALLDPYILYHWYILLYIK
jgi:hypothetical protein